MKTALANVHHRMAAAEQTTPQHLTEDDLMVAHAMASGHPALDASKCFGQNRWAVVRPFDLDADKSVLVRFEPAAEMNNHVGLRIIQDVKSEAVSWREPTCNRPIILDGNQNMRRCEGTLLHPAR